MSAVQRRDAVVIGAGLAGLSAALTLKDAGLDVEILEAAPLPGGLARADSVGGYAFARGPQSFLGSSPALGWLCERAGCAQDLVPARAAGRRWIRRHGVLHALPSSPASFLTSRLLSWRGKMRLLAEPLMRRKGATDDETAGAFFRRRLGSEATDALIGPFVSGVHASDPDRLEARSAFRRPWEWERDAGSMVLGALRERRADRPQRQGLWSLRGGLQALPDAAAAHLGDGMRLSTRVEDLRRDGDGWRVACDGGDRLARRVVLAVMPPHASRLLADLPEAASACDAVAMAPVAVVHVGGPAPPQRRPDGFGVLVHRDEGMDVLGIVFSSSLFPDLAPEGSWLQATYVGGSLHPRALERSDEELVDLAREATLRIMGFDPASGVSRVLRHPAGIPQLAPGHARRVAGARLACRRAGGLALAGSWLDGIGLEAAAASGRLAARTLLEEEAA